MEQNGNMFSNLAIAHNAHERWMHFHSAQLENKTTGAETWFAAINGECQRQTHRNSMLVRLHSGTSLFHTNNDGIMKIRSITRKLFAMARAQWPYNYMHFMYNAFKVWSSVHEIHFATYHFFCWSSIFGGYWSKWKSMNKSFQSFWQLIRSFDGLSEPFIIRGKNRDFGLRRNEWKWPKLVILCVGGLGNGENEFIRLLNWLAFRINIESFYGIHRVFEIFHLHYTHVQYSKKL